MKEEEEEAIQTRPAGKPGKVEVFTIPLGQGDSTVIKCPGPNSDISIIDMGCHGVCESMDIVQYVDLIETQFLGNDYSRLKRVFLTHPHDDHMKFAWNGNMEGLLEKWSAYYREYADEENALLDVYLGSLNGWQKKSDFIDFLKFGGIYDEDDPDTIIEVGNGFNVVDKSKWTSGNEITLCTAPRTVVTVTIVTSGPNAGSMLILFLLLQILKFVYLCTQRAN